MTNMKPTLDILTEMRDGTDEQIVSRHETILEREKELNSLKAGLRFLQERSASLSESIAFLQVGLQNEGIDPAVIRVPDQTVPEEKS
jgi:hypothetical protein